MKTRAKLKRWFKEANHTISKFISIPNQKKHRSNDARKVPKTSGSVITIPSSDVEVIYKKKAHNKLKASKGRIFRHSERGKSSKKRQKNTSSKKRRKEDPYSRFLTEATHDLSQSSTSKQISSRFERVSLMSSGASQLHGEKIYETVRKDKECYKKMLSTLQLAALIRAKKRDADDRFGLHKHQRDYNYKFSFKNSDGKCSRSIRTYAIKESLSVTSLSKTESSNTFCTSAKQKTIIDVKKLLQHQNIIMPVEVTTNPKSDSSKALANKMSYNSLKAKISQIRRLILDRKASVNKKEKCSWGGQIIIPTYVVQSTKETDTKSVVKVNEGKEIELHVHTLTPKTQDEGLTCGQSPLTRQNKTAKETANCRNYVPDKSSTSKSSAKVQETKKQDGELTCGQSPLIRQNKNRKEKTSCRNYVPDKSSTPKSSTNVQDTIKHDPQEGLRHGQNQLVKLPNEIHKNHVSDRPLVMATSTTRTQDTPKQKREDLKCGQSPLLKQNKPSSEKRSCRNYSPDGPLSSAKTKDTTKQDLVLQSPLRKQSRISNEITEYINDVKTTKSIIKMQDAPEQEEFRSSQSLRRNRFSNETSRNYAPTKSAPKSSGHGSSQQSQNDFLEKPLVITIKDPQSLTLTSDRASDFSVYKNDMDSFKCDGVNTYPVRVEQCPRATTSQASQTASSPKKKPPGCCKSSSKKSASHSPSSASTSSFNTSSHSPISSPSGKESSTSTPRKESSSDQKCPNEIALRSPPSPPLRVDSSRPLPSPKRSRKSSSSISCYGRSKRKKSKSPPPPIQRPMKGSSVSFDITHNPQPACKAQTQTNARKSSSYIHTRSKPSMVRRGSKSKGPRCCASSKRRSEMHMSEKRVNYTANKDLQRPPVVQPVLGMCTLKTCGTPVLDIKYAIVKITYFHNYTTYEMMRSTTVKPKNIPNYVEKIFVTKETKFAIT